MPCYGGCSFITVNKLKSYQDKTGTIKNYCKTCNYIKENIEISNINIYTKENTMFSGQIEENNIKYNVLKCKDNSNYYYYVPQ